MEKPIELKGCLSEECWSESLETVKMVSKKKKITSYIVLKGHAKDCFSIDMSSKKNLCSKDL